MGEVAEKIATLIDCMKAAGWSWRDLDAVSILLEDYIEIGSVRKTVYDVWRWKLLDVGGGLEWDHRDWLSGSEPIRADAQRRLLVSALLLRWFRRMKDWAAGLDAEGGFLIVRGKQRVAEVKPRGDEWEALLFKRRGFDSQIFEALEGAQGRALIHATRRAVNLTWRRRREQEPAELDLRLLEAVREEVERW